MDFSENYSFVVQDAVKGFYWENSRTTLHPFLVYYKLNDILKNKCYCVISNCMHHDTISVHVFLSKLLTELKTFLSFELIHYFSDGSAAQYKNFKNFMNLCHHYTRFRPKYHGSYFMMYTIKTNYFSRIYKKVSNYLINHFIQAIINKVYHLLLQYLILQLLQLLKVIFQIGLMSQAF